MEVKICEEKGEQGFIYRKGNRVIVVVLNIEQVLGSH